jgi:hypothetical protein
VRFIATAVLALMLAGIASGSSRAAAPIPGGEFTDNYGGDFYVVSDASKEWTIRGTSARPKVVEWIVKPAPGNTDPYRRQGLAALWAPTCARGRQTVHFRRSFFIAGPEYKLGALLHTVVHGQAFESLELRVNGAVVLKTKGTDGEFERTEKNLKRLRFGRNTIDVIAVKRPSAKGVKCNVSKATSFGIAFWISGRFGSDIGVLEPDPGDSHERVTGSTYTATKNFTIANKGPGGAAGVGFTLRAGIPQGSTDSVSVEPQHAANVGTCTQGTTGGDKHSPIIECHIFNVRAGQSVLLPMKFDFSLPKHPFGQVTMHLSWVLSPGGDDPTYTNNKREANVVLSDS